MGRGGGPDTATIAPSRSASGLLFGGRKQANARAREVPLLEASLELGDASFLQAEHQLSRRMPYPQQKKFANLNVIANTGLLVNPAENFREYRGHIAIGPKEDGSGREFYAVTAYGPKDQCGKSAHVEYRGPSLAQALGMLHTKMQQKQRKYQLLSNTGSAIITARNFEAAFQAQQQNN
jgi:hypothetical protein